MTKAVPFSPCHLDYTAARAIEMAEGNMLPAMQVNTHGAKTQGK